jgi:hypothetical protein
MGDAEYIYAFQKVIMPIAMEFAPELVISKLLQSSFVTFRHFYFQFLRDSMPPPEMSLENVSFPPQGMHT